MDDFTARAGLDDPHDEEIQLNAIPILIISIAREYIYCSRVNARSLYVTLLGDISPSCTCKASLSPILTTRHNYTMSLTMQTLYHLLIIKPKALIVNVMLASKWRPVF
jgi:hypothetical protein